MKVDVHVHTRGTHSSPEHWLAELLGARESYTEPHAALAEALRKGLDAVAVTDHDSAEVALALAREEPARVIPGCEYTVYGGSGSYAHVVVLGIDERRHEELARARRRGIERFTELARTCVGCAFFLAHPAWEAGPEKRGIDPAALCGWLEHFDVIETLNGHCTAENDIAKGLAGHFGKAGVGGSDSHAVSSVGEAWTESPAGTVDGFLDDLRCGNVRAGGSSPGRAGFVATAREVFAAFLRHEFLNAARARPPAGGRVGNGRAPRPALGRALRTAVDLSILPGLFWAPQAETRGHFERLGRRAERLRQRLVNHLELALARDVSGGGVAPGREGAEARAEERSRNGTIRLVLEKEPDLRARRWIEGMKAIREAFGDGRTSAART